MTSEVTERSAVRARVTQASRPSTPSIGAAAVTAASTASSASRVPERLGRPMRGSPHGPWPSRAASQSDSESGTGCPGWPPVRAGHLAGRRRRRGTARPAAAIGGTWRFTGRACSQPGGPAGRPVVTIGGGRGEGAGDGAATGGAGAAAGDGTAYGALPDAAPPAPATAAPAAPAAPAPATAPRGGRDAGGGGGNGRAAVGGTDSRWVTGRTRRTSMASVTGAPWA